MIVKYDGFREPLCISAEHDHLWQVTCHRRCGIGVTVVDLGFLCRTMAQPEV